MRLRIAKQSVWQNMWSNAENCQCCLVMCYSCKLRSKPKEDDQQNHELQQNTRAKNGMWRFFILINHSQSSAGTNYKFQQLGILKHTRNPWIFTRSNFSNIQAYTATRLHQMFAGSNSVSCNSPNRIVHENRLLPHDSLPNKYSLLQIASQLIKLRMRLALRRCE